MTFPVALAGRAVRNYVTRRPYCASFELTYNCNARCGHCHRGPVIRDETLASPERLLEICREIQPVVAIMSGGEPLIRRDLPQIVRLFKSGAAPIRIFVNTNGALLPRRYAALKEAGVDEFLISLDFPDARHDTFRSIPGLFGKIRTFIAGLTPQERRCVVLTSVFQSRNFREGRRLAELALEWGVNINFSAYSTLRTHDRSLLIAPDDMADFQAVVDDLLALKKRHGHVLTSDWVLRSMVTYFAGGDLGACRAGERTLVVNPDGSLSPCGLVIRSFPDRASMVREFTRDNPCTDCFTSTRANSERPARHIFMDHLPYLRRSAS